MVLVAQFSKAQIFKNFVDGLEELLAEATFKWTQSGLDILVLDAYDVSAVQLKLSASSFEFYQCSTFKSFGLRMAALIRIMKWVGPEDALTFLVSEAGNTFTVRYQSNGKKSEYELYLVCPRDLMIPEPAVACTLKLQADKFSRIVENLSNVSKTITITCQRDKGIEFSARGEDGEVCKELLKELEESPCSVSIKSEEPLTLNFSSEYLKLFAKRELFGSTLQVLLRPAFPIAVEYDFGEGNKLTCHLPPLSN